MYELPATTKLPVPLELKRYWRSTEVPANQKFGKCKFRQLPAKYRQEFRTGANRVEHALFYAEAYPWGIILLVPFFALYAAIPILVVMDWDSIPFMPWGWIALIPLVIGWYMTIRCMWGIVLSIWHRHWGNEIYGLLVDDEYLVNRSMTLWDWNDCVFLRRDQIRAFDITYERWASNGKVTRTYYLNAITHDKNGKWVRHRLGSDNHFTIHIRKLKEILIGDWQPLEGEWRLSDSDLSYNTVVKFHRSQGFSSSIGTITHYVNNENVFEATFRYRHLSHRRIQIEVVTEPHALEHLLWGEFEFEIRPTTRSGGDLYQLTFVEPFSDLIMYPLVRPAKRPVRPN